MYLRFAFACCGCLVATSVGLLRAAPVDLKTPAEAIVNDPQRSPTTAVAEATRLLEAKDYVAFLKRFVVPSEAPKIVERKGSIEEFAKWFGEQKAARLLEMLQAVKSVAPTLNADGTEAEFKIKEPIDGRKSITFKKVDQRWYIKN